MQIIKTDLIFNLDEFSAELLYIRLSRIAINFSLDREKVAPQCKGCLIIDREKMHDYYKMYKDQSFDITIFNDLLCKYL